ncbi:MAG: BrnA antitoxin family protein [Hyphomicrobiaceae bacterium]
MSADNMRKKSAKRLAKPSMELARLKAMRDEDIDTSDISERLDWTGAQIGRFYKPIKQQITLRIDADIIAWFKARGEGYQTALNEALRRHAREHAAPIGQAARTGAPCPESGVWKPVDGNGAGIPVALGSPMPPHRGKPVTWKLVQRAT